MEGTGSIQFLFGSFGNDLVHRGKRTPSGSHGHWSGGTIRGRNGHILAPLVKEREVGLSAGSLIVNFIRSLGQGSRAQAVGWPSWLKQAAGRFGPVDPSLPLRRQCFLVLDCETTGLQPGQGDRVTSLAAVRLLEGEIASEYFSTLVNPQRPVPQLATSITGITDAMLAGQPLLEEVLPEFLEFTRDGVITGFNVGFDLAFLNDGLLSSGRKTLCAAHSLDIFVLGRVLNPNCRRRSLEDMACAYNIPVEGRHTALGDSVMAARLLQAMIPDLEQKGIRNLQDLADFLCYCRMY